LVGSFNRANIFYSVRNKEQLNISHPRGAIGDLMDVITEQHQRASEDGFPCSGIVYVHKRSDASMLSQHITQVCLCFTTIFNPFPG